jgi:hypothetical protein
LYQNTQWNHGQPGDNHGNTKIVERLDGKTSPALDSGNGSNLFSGRIYNFLKPHAFKIRVAHPEMQKAITAAKKKNDRADAEKIADLLRVNMLPECYMAPTDLRELRRILRYRNHIERTAVKNK